MTTLSNHSLMVSIFKNAKTKRPEGSVSLPSWLTSDEYKSDVERYRDSLSSESSKLEKLKLPAITPSGIFDKRCISGLVQPSGLICIDIDSKDNPTHNMEELKSELGKLPYIFICMLSVSGKGLFCIIPYADWHLHKEHFYALEKEFAEMGVVIDKSCSDISRLRVCSYDPNPYINMNAEVYAKTLAKPTVQKVQRGKHIVKVPISRIQADTTQSKEQLSVEETLLRPSDLDSVNLATPISKTKEVQRILNYVITNNIDITVRFNDWLAIGYIVKAVYKNDGRAMFHQVSRFYPNYSETETDNLYTNIDNSDYRYKYERIREIASQYLSNISEILTG